MSIWVSYGPAAGKTWPDLTAADHDGTGRVMIDVAWTNMQEPEVVRLSLSRGNNDHGRSVELTGDEARSLIERLTWALDMASR